MLYQAVGECVKGSMLPHLDIGKIISEIKLLTEMAADV
jgi:hypothetical protein